MTDDTTPYANSVFEQPWWLETVAPGRWHEAIVEEKGEIVARLPYVLQNKWFGNCISMPKLTQTLGPWIKPEYRSFVPGNTQLSKQKEIIAELLRQLPKHRNFKMTFDNVNEYILPLRWHGYRMEPTFSYRIDKLAETKQVWENFSKSKKRDVKQAEKVVRLKENAKPEDLVQLSNKTYESQRRKNPFSETFLLRVMENAIKKGAGKLLLAWDGENNHAGTFLLYDENVCYYLLAGQDPAYKSNCAQTMIVWEAIRFAAGVSQAFDFEGSMVEGIEGFFRQFGGHQVINYHVSKSALPFEIAELMKPRVKRLLGYKI